jgi:hypothetical protein
VIADAHVHLHPDRLAAKVRAFMQQPRPDGIARLQMADIRGARRARQVFTTRPDLHVAQPADLAAVSSAQLNRTSCGCPT